MLPAALPLALLPDFGGGEFMLIVFVVMLLFGGDKMPQLAKSLGKSIREFRKAAGQVEQEIKRAIDEVPDTPSIQTAIKNAIEENKKSKVPALTPKPAPGTVAQTSPGVVVAPAPSPVADPTISPPPEVSAHLPPPPTPPTPPAQPPSAGPA